MNTPRRHIPTFSRQAGELTTATARENPATTLKGAAQGRQDLFKMMPDQLVVVTDRSHPLFDERVQLPLNESLVLSIMEMGILQPIVVRKNGELFEVVDGRQRVRAAMEANRRLSDSGSDKQIQVPVTSRRDDDRQAARVMVVANEVRQSDTPVVRARKAQRLLNMGMVLPEVAASFDLSITSLTDLLKLLETSTEVQNMVESGAVPVTAASAVASLPREEQGAAMEDIRSQGLTVTRQSVKDKVKARQEAKRTGAPEREVSLAPKKKTLGQVSDAYWEDGRQLPQALHDLLHWVMTGQGAKKVPGPKPHATLADYLKELNKAKT
jgi:ParB family transcriptional regulator, chromosome partitioning protein